MQAIMDFTGMDMPMVIWLAVGLSLLAFSEIAPRVFKSFPDELKED